MKSLVSTALCTLVLVSSVGGAAAPRGRAQARDRQQTFPEQGAIEKAARDYIDGWYAGDEERVARAIHPDLAKRGFRALPNGRQIFQTTSANTLLELTRAGIGKQSAKPKVKSLVIVLDVSANSAVVKTLTHENIDYLELAKVNGEWRIVNILWEPIGRTGAGQPSVDSTPPTPPPLPPLPSTP